MKLVDDIIYLRQEELIKRVWSRKDIKEKLEAIGRTHAPNTINTVPSNFSISREGDGIGNSVRHKGATPIFWRAGKGEFELIDDPFDESEARAQSRRLANARVRELSKPQKHTSTMQSQITSTSGSSSVARTKPETVSSDMHCIVPIALTEGGSNKTKSLTTEQKALAIVRGLLKTAYGEDVLIEEDRDGVDLRVTIDGKTERIEVKGTQDFDIAWQKLKVSSKKSHDALVSGDASIYRVVDVDSANPRVYILTHGEDFTLEPEPRWAVKRIPPDNERYPLQGKPYRYDRPFEPVALDDWEILK